MGALAVAGEQNAFNLFGAQHGTGPGPAGRAPVVVFNTPETHQILRRRSDHQGPFFAVVCHGKALFDRILGDRAFQAPDIAGRMKYSPLRMDGQNGRIVATALNHNGIEAGGIDGIRRAPAGIGFGEKAGQR